jgi:hypothetical protein
MMKQDVKKLYVGQLVGLWVIFFSAWCEAVCLGHLELKSSNKLFFAFAQNMVATKS